MKLLLLLSLAGTVAVAQKPELQVEVRNVTPVGTKTFPFLVGAHPDGSDSVDTEIGETEIPSIPLPGNIFYVWSVAPTTETYWLSPKEYRKLRVGEQHREDYDVRVNWSGGSLEIRWPGPLPPEMDSVWVTDGYSDFPDNFVAVKVQEGSMFQTVNPAFTRFKIIVWYNAKTISVNDNNAVNETHREANYSSITIVPHPIHENGEIRGLPHDVSSLILYDIHGNAVMTVPGLENAKDMVQLGESMILNFSMAGLSSGMYSLIVTDTQGRVFRYPILHQ